MNRTSLRVLLFATPFLVFWPGLPARSALAATPEVPLLAPSQISFRTLPNGVRSIVKAANGSDLVNIQVWVKAGSRFESEKESGAAHLIETLALRGSKNYQASDNGTDDGGASGAIRALGGDAGALTSRDSTFYSVTVATPYAARAMRIVADAVLHPDISAAAVEEGKLEVADDVARRSLDPVAGASDLAYATAFAKHPYRRAAIGSDSSVAGLTQKIIRSYYDRNYVGANISVVVVGQITAPAAQQLVAQNFATASSTKPTPPKPSAEAPLKNDVVARRRIVSREVIDLAWRSPGMDKPEDCVAMDTLLSLWREGLDANLRRVLLRDGEKGPLPPLVDSYDVDFLTQRDSGLFIISLVDPQDREGAVDAVIAEVKRIRDKGVSDEELARAKEELRQQYIEQSESVSGQAGALGFYDMIGSYRFAVEYLDRSAHVTSADLQRVATKYLTPDKYVRSEVSPLPRPRPDDQNNGPIITAQLHKDEVAG